MKNNPRCRECASKEYHRKKCNSHIGTVINGFRIVSGYGYNSNGSYRYKCVCLKCGSTVYRTRGELTARKGKGCINCQPDYHFKIDNNIAEGILPDGTPFQIDADFIPEFSQFYWHKNYKGYIQRGNRDMPKMLLHWFVLGYESKHTEIIDHINRNKTDCRKNNLRVITAHQNAMNHSKLSTNQSGFTGVFWNKRKQRWVSYIFTAGRHVYLGYLKDKIEAAQRYNYACKLLRGEYAGELNKVPEPSDEIKSIVESKLRTYLNYSADKAVFLLEE